MKRPYHAFYFKLLHKHHLVASILVLSYKWRAEGPRGRLGVKHLQGGRMLELKRNSLGASSSLSVRMGEVNVCWAVFACFMKEKPPLKESPCRRHILSQSWGRNRHKHICQREISIMTVVTFFFFMLQLYPTETLFWKKENSNLEPL